MPPSVRGRTRREIAKRDEIIFRRRTTVLGALVVAAFAAACGTTDAGISSKVKTNLTADEKIRAARIDVGVQKQVVTLSGTVDTSAIKERAVAVARGTDGVANVVDQIAVKEQRFGPGHGGEMMGTGMREGMDHAKGMDHPKEGRRE